MGYSPWECEELVTTEVTALTQVEVLRHLVLACNVNALLLGRGKC